MRNGYMQKCYFSKGEMPIKKLLRKQGFRIWEIRALFNHIELNKRVINERGMMWFRIEVRATTNKEGNAWLSPALRKWWKMKKSECEKI